MKSARKLNPSEPAAYDFFDLMEEQELSEWINGSVMPFVLSNLSVLSCLRK